MIYPQAIPQSTKEEAANIQNDFEAQFLYAAKNGHLERAERLLLDGAYDPSSDNNSIIQWACENGLAEVVKVLLKDPRVNINCKDNICIQMASEMGYLDLVELLLSNGRADPSSQNSIALWLACQNGHLEIVQKLVDDGRVDLSAKHEEMTGLEVALLHEFYELAQILLIASKSEQVMTRAMSVTGRRSIDIPRDTEGTSKSPTALFKNTHAFPTSAPNRALLKIHEGESAPASIKSLHPPRIKKIVDDLDSPTGSINSFEGSEKDLKEHKDKNFKAKRYRTGRSYGSIPEESDGIMTRQQISIDTSQKQLLELTRKRKEVPVGQYAIDLKVLQDAGVSPLSFGFNQALIQIVTPSGTLKKHRDRGSCYDYTKALLDFGKEFTDLSVEESTISAFEAFYSPFKSTLRSFFNLRNKRNPISLLAPPTTCLMPAATKVPTRRHSKK